MKYLSKKINLIKRNLIVVSIIGILLLSGGLYSLFRNDNNNSKVAYTAETKVEQEPVVETPVIKPESTPSVVETTKPTPSVAEPASKWPVTYTSSEASSITVVVNKKHKLPSTYVPDLTEVTGGQMRPDAAQAITSQLFKANEAGVGMKIISSYRSYSTQVTTYQKWVNQQGQAEADRSSARPGHSEHQTGLAVDLGNPDGSCNLLECFGSGAQGIWLANNAHTYGFIIRYPDGKESLTGYQYEPWHIRYVGVDIATAIYQSGQTLDQYYSVEAGGY